MRRTNIKTMALVALLVLLGAGLRPVAANNLVGVGVARLGDSIAVTITTSADCEYNAFLTDSKPERIVVDLSGVINDLSQKQFIGLPLKSIRSIRTSQFKSEPDAQARVVLDIRRPIEFRSYRQGNSIVVTLPAVSDERASVNWESSVTAQAVVAEPPAEKPVIVAEKPVSIPEPVVEAKPVETPVEKPVVEVAQSAPVQAPVETPAAVVEKPVETAPVVAEKTVEAEPVPVDVAEDVSMPQAAPPVVAPAASAAAGVEVDPTPKRKAIEYTANDVKDPFTPLVGLGKGNIKNGLPSLENLKLVGILEDNKSIGSALLEDGNGNGYILKPNDRIQSGYLVSVSDKKAIFEISEYGWTRTVALELQIPEIK